ncbi:glycosyltransferase [Psychrobacter fozii]|uniref:Glycosyltransferase involved in cell wall biosynthesis n=1 Tax=Psychrobacter fozii TaxID=198480 RepID=A0A2V4VKB6_9GAMM|nr:glycosyltransferase [Psychrobacter fozii]PYE39255.1 glycosyltransferase involved in cell wall biosynthesis [Psychrobacter fozii]
MKQHKKIVLLVINCLQGGGAERVVLTLGQGFYELGYEVHVLRFKPLVEYELSPDLHYHVLKFKPYKLIPGSERRDKLFARSVDKYVSQNIGQPDMILSNLDRADSILSNSKLPNITYIIHNTVSLLYKFNKNQDAEQLKRKMVEIYSKHPCVCVSEGAEKDFIKSFGNITPTAAIHNPIDRDNIQKQANAFVPEYQNYIIHVGSFKDAKRHDVLVKAYAKTDQSMPLLLLGQGKHKNEIENLVTALKLENKVVFLGFHENPFPYIKHAQFKVLTSDWEGFALVIAEALVLGTPVISTNCPSGPSELLPESNLMPMGDIEAIAEKMRQAMSNPQQFHAPFDESLLPVKIAEKYLEFSQRLDVIK